MIHWLIYGAAMIGVGWYLRVIYDHTGGRHLLDIEPSLSPKNLHGTRTVPGEVVHYAELAVGLGLTATRIRKGEA